MSRLFPDSEVRIDTRCPDCGESVVVRCRGAELLGVEPEGAVGHANEPVGKWSSNGWPFT